jgi:hypothetical protein
LNRRCNWGSPGNDKTQSQQTTQQQHSVSASFEVLLLVEVGHFSLINFYSSENGAIYER